MNIGVDARPLVKQKVGFGYFLENMLDAILEKDNQNHYYLFSDREVVYDVSHFPNVEIVNYKDNFLCPKSFYYYYRLPAFIRKKKIRLDVFWGTMHLMPRGFEQSVKKILTVHDFTHIRFPKSTTKYNLLISKLFFESSIQNSNQVICISHNTENELKEYYARACKGKEITTVYEGGCKNKTSNAIDESNIRPEIKEIKGKRYILFVGTIEPRKNIKLLLKAAPKLKGVVQVVICGKIGWEQKEVVEQLGRTDNLLYFNYVTQDEKLFLMKNTFCQVQPSLYEGFGLPVVESIQAGTVVLVANNSSLSELIEMNELKFETGCVTDFLQKVKDLVECTSLYDKAKVYCKNRGQCFQWSNAASSYLVYFGENLNA